MTLNDLQRMSQIKDISRDDLVKISDVEIDRSLALEERIESYLSQIKNPYHFLHNGLAVHLRFEEGGADLKSRMAAYLQSLKME